MANNYFRIGNGNLVYWATRLVTTVVGSQWSYYFGHNVVWKQDLKKGLSSDMLELKRDMQQQKHDLRIITEDLRELRNDVHEIKKELINK